MFRVALACYGIPEASGPEGAIAIEQEFTHRPWQKNVRCVWDGELLTLTVENDFDEDGLASIDEYAHAIACIADSGEGDILVKVEEFDELSAGDD